MSRTLLRSARALAILTIAAFGILLVAGCSSDSSDDKAPESTESAAVTVSDQWAKAADTGMTSLFGKLHNTGDKPVRIVGGSTDVANEVQLHEMAMSNGTMVMREKDGGFLIPAGGTITLAPGGLHIMIMDITKPIKALTNVTVTLRYSDGSTQKITAPARDFNGAQENYEGGEHS